MECQPFSNMEQEREGVLARLDPHVFFNSNHQFVQKPEAITYEQVASGQISLC